MIIPKLSHKQKILLSLIANTLFFSGIFSLKFFGFTTDLILVMVATAVFLEVIYLAVLIQMSVNKNNTNLEEMVKNIENIREGEEKAHTALIYIGHQMRAMQAELDILRKSGILKIRGNGHHPKVRA